MLRCLVALPTSRIALARNAGGAGHTSQAQSPPNTLRRAAASASGSCDGEAALAALKHAVQKPQELVAIVDRDNTVVGSATRQEMRQQDLIHRASFTIIFNKKGEIFVQKRVAFKETFPGHHDPAPGGVVGSGESYEENAIAELKEEMGIEGVRPQHHLNFWFEMPGLRMWGALFSCTYDGEMTLQPEEVESGEWRSVADVRRLLETGPVCLDSKAAVEKYFDMVSKSGK